MKLYFLQVFGNELIEQAKNEITALKFNQKYLAVGQSDGAVFIFNYKSRGKPPFNKNGELHSSTIMKVAACFTPFENEYDLLYGTNIRPDIVDIHFAGHNDYLAIIANQRNVYICKITENNARYALAGDYMTLPQRTSDHYLGRVSKKYLFSNVSFNYVNALTVYDDFFSVFDEFAVKRYNFDRLGAVQLFDFTPTGLDQRYETITSGQQESYFLLSFSTSEGAIHRLDDRCNIAREGSQLVFETNHRIHSYKLEGHKYYIRQNDRVSIYDDRAEASAVEHILDPHTRVYYDATRYILDVYNGAWVTGYPGGYVQMGFNNSQDIYQFYAKFKLKRTKNSIFAGVGGLYIVQNGLTQHSNFRETSGPVKARCVAFGEYQLAVGCGGNLFLYGWVKE